MKARCLLLSCLALSPAACGGAGDKRDSEPEKQPPATLDLRDGSFRGVALGDSVQKMREIFGAKEPAAEGEPWTALSVGDDEDYSPIVLALGREAKPVPEAGYRYEHVAFMTRRSKIGAIIVNDPNARDGAAGIRIGDKLGRVQALYEVRCGTANENTEYEPFPACVGQTAPEVYVWFGGDPIRNITLSRVRPDGV
jgi:hypothetical protein